MWGILRIVLLIGNTLLFVVLASDIAGASHRDPEIWIAWGILICLALNFVYLLAHKGSSGRIFRLIGLWFDAKESELRRRAGQDK
jgi:hypothetical protein